jgi:hypothetical protein
MNQKEVEISERLFRTKYGQLGKQEQHVANQLIKTSVKCIGCTMTQ